jgi:hypothetical protein
MFTGFERIGLIENNSGQKTEGRGQKTQVSGVPPQADQVSEFKD